MLRAAAFSAILLLVLAFPVVVSAEKVVLDGDVADTQLTQLVPGKVVELAMKYDVTFSSVHGDDENKDSEAMFASVRIRVGLGNDNVKVWVYKNNEEIYSAVVASQGGFAINKRVSGSVNVKISVECDGTTYVYVAGKQVTTISIPTNSATSVIADKDVELVRSSRVTCPGQEPPPDYQGDENAGGIDLSGLWGTVQKAIAIIILSGALILVILMALGGRKAAKRAGLVMASSAAPLLLLGILFLLLVGAAAAMTGFDLGALAGAGVTSSSTTAPSTTTVTTTATPRLLDSGKYTWLPSCGQGTPYLRVEIDNGRISSISVVYDTATFGPESAGLAAKYLVYIYDDRGRLVWSGYADPINSVSGDQVGVPDGLAQVQIDRYCGDTAPVTFRVELYSG